MSMKNSNDTIENGTRDLTACRVVLQQLRQGVLRFYMLIVTLYSDTDEVNNLN
jgi:hypothetical protein